MEIFDNPMVQVCGSFVHFKDVETLVSCSDSYIAYERSIYMKDYGLCYEDAQACAQMEYDNKLETMSNELKFKLLQSHMASKRCLVYDHTGRAFPTLGYMCKHWHVQPFTYTKRRSLGWSVKDSLCGRKSISLTKVKQEEHKWSKWFGTYTS